MKTTLILPDGSAFDSSMVAAIRWTKERTGSYGSPARLHIDIYQDSGMGFGLNSRVIQQGHVVDMDSDEAAQGACKMLVEAWTGRLAIEATAS